MGNVRNPVGPLPSSIYWRRRAVVLCLLAVAAALVVWLVLPGTGGGRGRAASGPGHSRSPLPSITPGPTSSRPGITTEPGGRGSGGSGDGGTGSGSPSASSTGRGAAAAGGPDGGSAAGGSDGGTSGQPGSGARLAVGTSVPDCSGGHARLEVRSVHKGYAPGQKAQFAITAVNSGTSTCKVNFSAVGTVVTVSDSTGHHVWASDDCPPGRTPYLLGVPAGGSTIDDVTWNRAVSGPDCTEPAGTAPAGSGTYHLRVAVPGLAPATTSFTLS